MTSRKWLYSYRILTARLHEETDSLTTQAESSAAQSKPPSATAEPPEAKLAKQALRLTPGRKA
jgi:hypothetical protein